MWRLGDLNWFDVSLEGALHLLRRSGLPTRVDEAKLTAVLTQAAGRIAGPGLVASSTVTFWPSASVTWWPKRPLSDGPRPWDESM